ncbi:MAG: outer membrane beta-barrel protein [Pseudomonadales bacterium]|nr:outer membrane beta-barrel protein [Pseudomonadales bacterium]
MHKIIAIIAISSSFFTMPVFSQDVEELQALSGKKIAIGLNLFTSTNSVDIGSSVDNDSNGLALNVAYLLAENWRVQGYYQYESYENSIYAGGDNDRLNELGVNLIRVFDIGAKFSPFAQAGLGYGWMDLEANTESSANATSLKLGIGVIYQFIPSFEAVAGLDLQYRDWTDVQIGFDDLEADETSSKLYLGANFIF